MGSSASDAALAQRERGVQRRLVQFALDDPEPLLLHGEPIFRDGDCVGHLTSAMYGHTIGSSIGMGYVHAPSIDVPRRWFEDGNYSIEVAGVAVAARASLRALLRPDVGTHPRLTRAQSSADPNHRSASGS